MGECRSGPCEEAVTPFLYNSDGVKTPGAAEGNGGVNNGNKAALKDGAGATAAEEEERHRREEVDASELRERLGVCLDAMRDPPPPWLKMKSRSEDPGAVFYFNPATNQTRWDFPEEDEGGGGGGAGAACGVDDDDDDDEEEDEPIVVSRLTRAQDSAAQFLSKQR